MKNLNVTKRGNVYQYRFEIEKVNGKRKFITKSGFKTKNESYIEGQKTIVEYKVIESKSRNNNVQMVFARKDGTYSGTDIIKYPFK